MELNLASTCDVLVLGSGIAGISAALTAAESGASVILVCKGRLFSGSREPRHTGWFCQNDKTHTRRTLRCKVGSHGRQV